MVTRDFLRSRRRGELTQEEATALEAAVLRIETFPPRRVVTRTGAPVSNCMLLIDGFMCRYMDDREGDRQLVCFQVPGDFVDLHGYPLARLDHDVATITECRVALIPHDRVSELIAQFPNLARLLWFSTMIDAAMHREWIFRLGRLEAIGRVAHFFLETHARMVAVGRVQGHRFELPLTQQDLGEACALTSVHVNRTLRRLREMGLADMSNGEVVIRDYKAMSMLAEFEPDYLYLDPSVDPSRG